MDERTLKHGMRSRHGITASLLLVGLCGLAGAAAAKPYPDLDAAVSGITRGLVEHGGLEGRKVLVSPHDFSEMITGRSLPLSVLLREKFVPALASRGVRVVLPGVDEDEVMVLQGQWSVERDSGSIHFLMKVTELAADGPQVVAAAKGDVPAESIDTSYLEPDLESRGRYVVRVLESGVRVPHRRTVYVRPVAVEGVAQPARLGAYLAGWLEQALAESRLFTPVDAGATLGGISVGEVRTRGIRPAAKASREAAASSQAQAVDLAQAPGTATPGADASTPGSLTRDLVAADSELIGEAFDFGAHIEVRLHVRGGEMRQVTAASVDLDKAFLPPAMLNEPARACRDPSLPENPSFDLELTTTKGEGLVTYHDGELIRLVVRPSRASWLHVFDIDSGCEVTLLYPLPGTPNESLAAGVPVVLPDEKLPYVLRVGEPYGKDTILAVAAAHRIDLPEELIAGGAGISALNAWLRALRAHNPDGYAEARAIVVTAP